MFINTFNGSSTCSKALFDIATSNLFALRLMKESTTCIPKDLLVFERGLSQSQLLFYNLEHLIQTSQVKQHHLG